ncbi:MAG: TRAP transporter substrate-binding protein [Chloroflexota bacterium]
MRLAHAMTPEAATSRASELFGNIVEARSGGRIKFEYFPGAQLGKSPELVEMARTGAIEVSPNALLYLSSMIPDVGALDLPFLWDSSLDAWLAYHGPAIAYIENKMEAAGMKSIGWTCYGPRDDATTRPVTKVEDYKGLKIRVAPSPVYIKTWESWGAKPISVPMGEVFTALEAGTVDGVSFDAETLLTQKFYEVAPNILLSGWVYTFTVYGTNKAWFDSLPKDLQDIVLESNEVVGDWLSMTIERARVTSAKKMEELGATVTVLPPGEKAKLKAMVKPVYDFAKTEYSPEFVNLLLGQ